MSDNEEIDWDAVKIIFAYILACVMAVVGGARHQIINYFDTERLVIALIIVFVCLIYIWYKLLWEK